MDIPLDMNLLPAANVFMSSVEQDFRAQTKIQGREDYSAFYAPCVPSPLLVLCTNPGGSADDFRIVDVPKGQHEYIEGHGRTSQNLGRLLREVLNTSSAEGIRGVQGSNVIWRRSPNLASLRMPKSSAARETAPFLTRVISHISPKAILFGGGTAYDLFVEAHRCRVQRFDEETVMGPNGSNNAVYFSRSMLTLDYLPHAVEAFVILHPAKGLRDVAVDRLKLHIAPLFAN